MKILNLYSGIGGNRGGWQLNDEDIVFAVEINPIIAEIYKEHFPNDTVIVADAHQYLLDHFREFDFIWSSPPCPTHSKVRKSLAIKKDKNGNQYEQNKPVYPNMTLYEEIILLDNYFDGFYCIENVIPFYEPLIFGQKLGRHLFWSNVKFNEKIKFDIRGNFDNTDLLAKDLGYDISNWHGVDKKLLLRNCCEADISEYIFNEVRKAMGLNIIKNDISQVTIFDFI